ncbi:MAG TPA: pilin [Dongiaceae bacterium]|nr:pilin [Dongiaceae bacterium]
MKRFLTTITSIALSIATVLTIGLSTPTFAQSSIQNGVNAARGNGQPAELFGNGGVITTITNVLLFVVGALAVIMIIWGGIRYATSAGNASNVTAAKNTILYAIVGLIIAFLAFAIVNWVLSALNPGGGSGFTNT